MKYIYIVQKLPKEIIEMLRESPDQLGGAIVDDQLIRAMVILNKTPFDVLTENDLEEIFRVSNETMPLPLTGWVEGVGFSDYVVDADLGIIYKCKPVGWEVIVK